MKVIFMTWEWKIGDPVDDSNGGTMDAMNWGHGDDDEWDDYVSRNYEDNRSYESYKPQLTSEQKNRRRLSYKKDEEAADQINRRTEFQVLSIDYMQY